MGFALAHEAASRGASVTLITGPSAQETSHPDIKRIDILSASEMLDHCLQIFPECDLTIMSAAVADYRIKKPFDLKIKKNKAPLQLMLIPTTDILAELGKMKKKNQMIIGFALESGNEIANAKQKMRSKNLDMIVLNSLKDQGAGFGGNTNKVTIITGKNKIFRGTLKDKTEVAKDILDVAVSEFYK